MSSRPRTCRRPSVPKRNSRGLVLVVEDDFALRRAIAEALVLAGYRVRAAADGREALLELSLEPTRPCTVVLDLAMPTMTGEEFIERLKSSDALGDVRIVVITAMQPLPRLPVQALLAKPFQMAELLDAVKQACG
nr:MULTISPECIES: response regulator [Myxococcaceae]